MIVNTLIVVVSFVLMLGILVFIHELGHYGMGKLFRTRVEQFSVGFGKPILNRTTASGEEWKIGRWPLGGFVKFAGDDDATGFNTRDRDSLRSEYGDAADTLFQFKPLYQRTLIVAAGPLANFILAAFLFFISFWVFGDDRTPALVQDVRPDSAASEAGFLPGDRVTRIDDRKIARAQDLMNYVVLRADETMAVEVERDGRTVELTATPRRETRKDGIGGDAEMGTLGITLGNGQLNAQSFTAGEAAVAGVKRVGEATAMTGTYVGRLFSGKEDGKALGGPLRIMAVTGKVAVATSRAEAAPASARLKAFTASMLGLAGLLSVGLGLANLLPIPALDGGHLLYYGYEAVARKPLSHEAQALGYRLGTALLIGIFILLTFNDTGYIRSLLS